MSRYRKPFRDDEQWMREKAAAEDGCIVSVGGLVTDMERMPAEGRASVTIIDDGGAKLKVESKIVEENGKKK